MEVTAGTDTIRGIGGNVDNVGETSVEILRVGAFVYKDEEFSVLDVVHDQDNDGVLGTPFIGSQVVTLDYENRLLKLTRNRDFVPDKEDKALPLELSEFERPLIGLDLGGKRELLLMDTGNEGTIDLYAPFAEKNELYKAYAPTLTMSRKRGIGGPVRGSYARFPGVKVGGYDLKNLVGTLAPAKGGMSSADSSKTGGEIAGNVGSKVWERFTVTLDYENERAYVRPNSSLGDPFDAPDFGASIPDSDGVVTEVVPNSPAQEAGIVVGDTIVTIEGKTIAELLALAAAKSSGPKDEKEDKREKKKVLHIKLRGADGVEREVVVTRRDLI